MTKLHHAIIEAACGVLGYPPEARARRVINALAEHMPEEAVEQTACKLHDSIVVGGEGYSAAPDYVKVHWRGYARTTIADFLKSVGETP